MSASNAAVAASQPPSRQRAVVPLENIGKTDIGTNAAHVDRWLRSISGDIVTLERVKTVAGAVPVLGNLLALVDVLGDLVDIYEKGDQAGFDEWFELGTDLIGVIPGGGAANVALRPVLHALKKEIVNIAKGELSDAFLEMLEKHLHDSRNGELDDFAKGALARVDEFLEGCAALSDQVIDGLIEALEFVAGDRQAKPAASAGGGPEYKPEVTSFGSLLARALDAYREVNAQAASAIAGVVVTAGIKEELRAAVRSLRDIKGQVRPKLQQIANGANGLKPILQKLLNAALKRKEKRGKAPSKQAAINEGQTADARQPRGGGMVESTRREEKAKKDGGCKTCPANAESAPPAKNTWQPWRKPTACYAWWSGWRKARPARRKPAKRAGFRAGIS